MNRLKKPVQVTLLSVSTMLSVVTAQENAAPEAVPSQNNAPSVSGIPGEMIEEGKPFAQIKLDSYVSDPEDKPETMRWTATGQKDLQVTIANRIATIKAPSADWNGEETITFTATDPKGASGAETVTFTVSSVNDKPVIKPIPGQDIDEGRSFTPVKLDDFIDDIDHPDDQISWTVDVQSTSKDKADGDLYVNIDDKRVATFVLPDTNWFGASKVIFTATDGEGASVSTSANFNVKSVNDLPIVQKAPDQSIEEGYEFDTFNLNDLVSDADDDYSKIKWEVSGGKDLKVIIDKYNTVSVKIPNPDWNGPTETFTFTATDPKGGQAKFNVAFSVKSVNDAPEMGMVKDQTIDEGKTFAPINLAEVVKDADHSFDKLKWNFSCNKDLKIQLNGTVATITAPDSNWNGSEVVTFTATDAEGGKANTSATFTVRSINDVPTLAKIADQNIQEKQLFTAINLNDLVHDADHPKSALKWEISGNKDLKIALDKNGVATVTAPSKFWNGTERVTFTVTDPDGGKASQVVTFAVKSVNDVPVLGAIKGQSIDEGKEFAPIALDAIVTDDDHEKSRLRWTIKGNKDIKATMDANRVVTLKTPNENWCGAETISFTVSDPENATAEANVVFEARCINDKPELKTIANQDVDEGKAFRSIRLDDLVSDADNKKEELKWTAQVVSAAAPTKKGAAPAPASDLKVTIDANRVATVTAPDSNWNGSRKIIFTVTDPAGASASQTATFNVRSINDVPQIHKDLSSPKTINEGEQFPEIDLAATVRDADHALSSLKMTVSGNNQLKAVVAGNKLKVTTPDAEWAGKETIVLSITDPEGGKAEARIPYEVKAVNDPPTLAKIADQKIKEGESFKPVNLADIVKDPDNKLNELQWTIAGAKKLKAEVKAGQLVVTAPDANYWGPAETLTITAKDPGGATASATATFEVSSVNDLPVIKAIPPQNIREGQTFKQIRLDDYVSDADHSNSQLNWSASVSGSKAAPAKKGAAPVASSNDLKVQIDGNRVASIVMPDSNWFGERVVTFTVTDPEGGKAVQAVGLNVTSVNDAPVLAKIPDQVIPEGGKFTTLELAGLVRDADHPASALKYEVSGGRELKSSVNAKGSLVVTTPNADWSGEEKLTVVISDPEGGRATQPVVFKATPVNDAPVVKALAGQKIKEGEKFQIIELSDIVTDVDNKPNELVWTASGNKDLKVEFNKGRPQARVVAPDTNWYGKETITFTVKDPAGASASTQATFEVTPVNDNPTLAKAQDQAIEEGGKFASIDFGRLVKDSDNKLDELSWTLDDGQPGGKDAKGKPTKGKAPTVKHQVRFNIDEKGVLTAQVPDDNWYGSEVVRVNVFDPAKGKASVDVKFVVKPVNDAPVITAKLEDQTTLEGTPFKPIKLDNFISDVDHKPHEIRWSASSMRFDVMINSGREALVKPKRADWSGEDKITFTATDPLGAKTSFTTNFVVKHVNSAPEMRKIPDQTVQEDMPFKPIKMTDFARDKDHKFDELKWEISGNKELLVSIDRVRQEILVKTPRENWNGKPETLSFKVTDPEGASKTETATFTVNPVNDAPIVISHAYQTREGEPLNVSKADGVLSGASDPDGEKPDNAMLVNRPSNGMLTLNPDGSFSYTPKPGFYGLDEFTFRARDKGGALSTVERAEINVSFRVGDVRKEDAKKEVKKDVKDKASEKAADLKKKIK